MSKSRATAQIPRFGAGPLRLIIPARKATPAPPIGPALGQYGIKSFEFCKKFNELSKIYIEGTPIPTDIHTNPNGSYEIKLNIPNTKYLVRKAAKIDESIVYNWGDPPIGKITLKHLYEIAKIKSIAHDGTAISDLEPEARKIMGRCKIWGIEIVP